MHRQRYTHFQICLRYFGVKEGQLLTIDMCFSLLISTEAWLFQLKTFHILVWESRSQELLFSSTCHLCFCRCKCDPHCTHTFLGICTETIPTKESSVIVVASVNPTICLSLCCLSGAYTFVSNFTYSIPKDKDDGRSCFCLVPYTPHLNQFFSVRSFGSSCGGFLK